MEKENTLSRSVVQMPVRLGNIEENRPHHPAGARRPANLDRCHFPSRHHPMVKRRTPGRDHDLIRVSGQQVSQDAHSDPKQPCGRMCRSGFQRQSQDHKLPLPQQAQRFRRLLESAFPAHDVHLSQRQVHLAVVSPTFIVPSRRVPMQGFSRKPPFLLSAGKITAASRSTGG